MRLRILRNDYLLELNNEKHTVLNDERGSPF